MQTPTATDLRQYSDELLDLLWDRVEAFRPAITELREQRQMERERWNSANLLSAWLQAWQEYRRLVGYPTDGYADFEADSWHHCQRRIRVLRHRSLRCMCQRNRRRG